MLCYSKSRPHSGFQETTFFSEKMQDAQELFSGANKILSQGRIDVEIQSVDIYIKDLISRKLQLKKLSTREFTKEIFQIPEGGD